jgi:cysteine synthase B
MGELNDFPTIEAFVGGTPLVRMQRLPGMNGNVVLGKLEGNNPAGSVKDRPALSMIQRAEARGDIKPGDTLIEATSGNTGIALAMAAAIKGYRMVLIMPAHMSAERRAAMRAFGAEIVLVTKQEGMEGARDWRRLWSAEAKGGCWISSPTRTTLCLIMKARARKSGGRPGAGLPILSAPWAPPARSWAYPVI